MTGFYDITTILKNQLILDPFVNTVTEGDIFEVDLGKQTIFPLSHIMVNQATREGHAIRFNVTIMCMDIVDKTKDETTDSFRGNDNEQDVLNTQLAVALRCVEVLDRGDLRESATLDGEVTFEPFTERFENYLAGWSATFDVLVRNTMTSCDSGASLITCPLANYIVEYADGTPIESGTIASGATKTIVVPNCPACDSANWTLLDTDGNVLDSGTIPSGGSANITAPDATVNINGSLWDTVLSGGTENISVRQSTGSTQVGSIQGQYFRIDDSVISNSDASYSVNVKAEDPLSLPDSQINVNSVNEGNVVSVKTIDVNITDGTNPVTPDAVSLSGNTLTVQVPSGGVAPVGATLMKTGQTISYATGDDGDIQAGRATDFFTLANPNPFGTNARFTDELGNYVTASAYFFANGTPTSYFNVFLNKVLVDWSTYDVVAGTVLMYYFGEMNGTQRTWADYLTWCQGLSILGFTWRGVNENELFNLKNPKYIGVTRYPPFSGWLGLFGGAFWSTTTYEITSTVAYALDNYTGNLGQKNKTTAAYCIASRYATVTGTTLS